MSPLLFEEEISFCSILDRICSDAGKKYVKFLLIPIEPPNICIEEVKYLTSIFFEAVINNLL